MQGDRGINETREKKDILKVSLKGISLWSEWV